MLKLRILSCGADNLYYTSSLDLLWGEGFSRLCGGYDSLLNAGCGLTGYYLYYLYYLYCVFGVHDDDCRTECRRFLAKRSPLLTFEGNHAAVGSHRAFG